MALMFGNLTPALTSKAVGAQGDTNSDTNSNGNGGKKRRRRRGGRGRSNT